MNFETRFRNFDTSTFEPNVTERYRFNKKVIAGVKPFKVRFKGELVTPKVKLKDGREVEILEREMRKCPSCIGAGYAFSDNCKDCRESGEIAIFHVRALQQEK
ncbi:hypothetical protein A3B18_00180 [Candidatus Giovannonibacteria bacterium RIFCSPLOWO2_01_FULL_46_13]|uniref:Uncharacterized protein n=1 Tax=Candidatus Giovannonibacteria bacterium RIFCSPLOWO2_01_FULL_46_13 TaxID=1798352 RepID=A0A1F5X380_9BACT|nr:MAG: hypothetical protein A3B18_00180 [Candidatus Giovannonibacteria bacterium RIFCSPLOWO2_01_FULL_46_13]